jgi:hypothetical protein
MLTPTAARALAETYLRRRSNETLDEKIGDGKDGYVWRTSEPSALKVHQTYTSYSFERDAYMRLRDLKIDIVGRFDVPKLLDYDDELNAIEMTIVFPPFMVDFASARLDIPPDLIEDEGNTFVDLIRERFDERADEVMALHYELIERAGIYLLHMHADNIKFR